jgi:ketosteroid isomerase-like protein
MVEGVDGLLIAAVAPSDLVGGYSAARAESVGQCVTVTSDDALRFADDWIRAWNERDLEAVLSHYADNVFFTSPLAQRFVPDSGGTVHGKDALRAYWTVALAGHPDLHFTLANVYLGVDTLVIHYRNQAGGLVSEVMTFSDGLVTVGHATQALS